MDLFHLFSILILLVAAFAYINFRFIKLPSTIGIMLVSIFFSIVLLIIGYFNKQFYELSQAWLKQYNFSELLLDSMLSFMLFAGAIHIRWEDLKQERLSIILFSTLSVIISTIVIGYVFYLLVPLFGFQIPLIHCLLFGCLISPTDPIAVLAILKKAGVGKSLETKIAGESLFNDGVAVVVFISLLHIAQSGIEDFSLSNALLLFSKEAIGGLILGFIFGYISYKLISSIDQYQVEVFITLACVMSAYTIAHYLHISGPLAMVVAGLITGNQGKEKGMSAITSDYIDKFWELIDEILNAALFVLIGLELILIEMNMHYLVLGLSCIVLALFARYFSLLLPALFIRFKEKIPKATLLMLTWGGLRGGISVALALSLSTDMNKNIIVTITYIIVCFSIIVQGLSIGPLSNKINLRSPASDK